MSYSTWCTPPTSTDGPFAIRSARGAAVGAPLDADLVELPIGKGRVVREGGDVAVFGLGKSLHAALEAADALAESGISCAVVNPVFAKPLDTELISEMALKVGRIVTVEENVLAGGFGSAVLEAWRTPTWTTSRCCASACRTGSSSTARRDAQRRRLGLDPQGIAEQIRRRFFTAADTEPALRESLPPPSATPERRLPFRLLLASRSLVGGHEPAENSARNASNRPSDTAARMSSISLSTNLRLCSVASR